MEISNHNVRQVLSSAEMVIQNHRAELLAGAQTPNNNVPEKPGDVTKVVLSPEAETLQNDLQKKEQGEKQQKKKEEREETTEKNVNEISFGNIGKIIDLNA